MIQPTVSIFRGKGQSYEVSNGVLSAVITSLQDVDFSSYGKVVSHGLTAIDNVRLVNCASYYAKEVECKQGKYPTLNPIDDLINKVLADKSMVVDVKIKLGILHVLWLIITRHRQFIKLFVQR